MRRDVRHGKVLVDWSQNNPAKATVAAYSLRPRPRPTVSTPVTWDEVAGCERSGDPGRLVFGWRASLPAQVPGAAIRSSPMSSAGAEWVSPPAETRSAPAAA